MGWRDGLRDGLVEKAGFVGGGDDGRPDAGFPGGVHGEFGERYVNHRFPGIEQFY